jgi:hypothetical protein
MPWSTPRTTSTKIALPRRLAERSHFPSSALCYSDRCRYAAAQAGLAISSMAPWVLIKELCVTTNRRQRTISMTSLMGAPLFTEFSSRHTTFSRYQRNPKLIGTAVNAPSAVPNTLLEGELTRT